MFAFVFLIVRAGSSVTSKTVPSAKMARTLISESRWLSVNREYVKTKFNEVGTGVGVEKSIVTPLTQLSTGISMRREAPAEVVPSVIHVARTRVAPTPLGTFASTH